MLLGREQVLAHPLLRLVPAGNRLQPLVPLETFADPALRGLATGEPVTAFAEAWARNVHIVRVRGQHGASELVLFKEIHGFGERPWTVGLALPEVAIHPILLPLRLFVVVAAGIALLALLAAVAIGRRLARPVMQVTAAVERVSKLELDALAALPGSRIAELDDESTTVSELLQAHLPESHVVKCFNNVPASGMVSLAKPAGDPDRSVLAIAGDDAGAKEVVAELIDDAGFTAGDVGGTADAAVMEAPRREGAVYGEEFNAEDGRAFVDAPALGEAGSHLVEEGVDRALHILDAQFRVFPRQGLKELRSDHASIPDPAAAWAQQAWPRKRPRSCNG